MTAAGMAAVRNFVKDSIAYAMYRVGSTDYRAAITSAEVGADGKVRIAFVIDHTVTGSGKVTRVQLFDRWGNCWAEKSVSIQRNSPTGGIYYRVTVSVVEE